MTLFVKRNVCKKILKIFLKKILKISKPTKRQKGMSIFAIENMQLLRIFEKPCVFCEKNLRKAQSDAIMKSKFLGRVCAAERKAYANENDVPMVRRGQ